MKSNKSYTIIAAAYVLSAAVLSAGLTACDTLFGGDDLKSVITSEVKTATADTVTLTVRPDPETNGGVTSLSSTDQKVGIKFPISTTVFSEYAFVGWAELGGKNAISFADPKAASTTAMVNKDADGIIIQANYNKRPTVDETIPGNSKDNINRNSSIIIIFDEPMDPSTINFDNISVTSKRSRSPDTPVSIIDKFFPPEPAEGNHYYTLRLRNTDEAGLMGETQTIAVVVSKNVQDANGAAMKEDRKWSFDTGISSDQDPPVLNSITVKKSNGTALYSEGSVSYTNARDILLGTSTYDPDGGTVQYITITESSAGNDDIVTRIYYLTSIPYSLTSAGEGAKDIKIQTEDFFGNISDPLTATVFLDTENPTVSDFTLRNNSTPSTEYTNGQVLIAAVDASDGGSGIAATEYDRGDNNWNPVPAPGTPFTLTGSSGDELAVRVRTTDKAGNVSGIEQKTIIMDKSLPVVSAVSLRSNHTNQNYVRTGRTVTMNFTVDDPGTNAAGFAAGYKPAVKIAGHDIDAVDVAFDTVTGAGSAIHTMVDEDAEGPVSYSITAVDQAGNPSAAFISGATQNVVFDRTVPVVSNVRLRSLSNTGREDYAKVDHVVTMTFTVADPGTNATGFAADYKPAVKIAGHDIDADKVTFNRTTGAGSATYTMASDDAEGTVSYSITAEDQAGNSSAAFTSGATQNVGFDKTPPVVQISEPGTSIGVKKDAVVTYTLNFSVTDNRSPISIAANLESLVSVIQVEGNAAATRAVSVGGNPRTVTLTVGTGNGNIGIRVAAGSVTDYAGNPAVVKDSTSSVLVDNTLPVVSAVSLRSDHTDQDYARTGSKVTMTFTVDDPGAYAAGFAADYKPAVKIAGHDIDAEDVAFNSATGAGSAAYTMVDGDTEGTVSYSITAADQAGNSSAAFISGATQNVVFDTSKPEISNVTLRSLANTGREDYAMVGHVITMTFTVADPGANATGFAADYKPAVKIAGHNLLAAAVTFDPATGAGSATYKMVDGDAEGTVSYSIIAVDQAGNPSAPFTSGAAQNVGFDKTPPTVQISGPGTSIGVKKDAEVTYTLTFSDPDDRSPFDIAANLESLVSVIQVGGYAAATRAVNEVDDIWTVTLTIGDGNGNIGIRVAAGSVTDYAGNTAIAKDSDISVLVDNTPPTVANVSLRSNHTDQNYAMVDHEVTMTFTITDPGAYAAGFAAGYKPDIQIAGQPIDAADVTFDIATGAGSATYTMNSGDAEGTVSYSITAGDQAGNRSSPFTAGATQNVVFDRTGPVVSNVSLRSNYTNQSYANDYHLVTMTFTVDDPGTDASGFAAGYKPAVKIAGHDIDTAAVNFDTFSGMGTATYFMDPDDAEGTVSYSITAEDQAGNSSDAFTSGAAQDVVFDHTPPIVEISGPSIATGVKAGAEVTYTLTFSDPDDRSPFDIAANLESLVSVIQILGDAAATRVVNEIDNIWTVTLTVGSGDGEVGISVAADSVTDYAGNKAVAANSTVPVLVDNTLPVVSVVSLRSDHTSQGYARVGSKITMNFTVGDPFADPIGNPDTNPSGFAADYKPAVQIAGHDIPAADVTFDTATGMGSATYTMVSGDVEGTVSYSIIAADQAGNPSDPFISGAAQDVDFDKTVPIVDVGSTSYDNAEKDLTLVFTGTDASGFAYIKYSGKYTTAQASPTFGAPVQLPAASPYTVSIGLNLNTNGDRFYYVVIDGAGNESAVRHIIRESGVPVSKSMTSGTPTGRPASAPKKTLGIPAVQSFPVRRSAQNWNARPAAFAVNVPNALNGATESPASGRTDGAAAKPQTAAATPMPAAKPVRDTEPIPPAAPPETAADTTAPAEAPDTADEQVADAGPVKSGGAPLPASEGQSPSVPEKDQSGEKFPWDGPWNRNPAFARQLDGGKMKREEEEPDA